MTLSQPTPLPRVSWNSIEITQFQSSEVYSGNLVGYQFQVAAVARCDCKDKGLCMPSTLGAYIPSHDSLLIFPLVPGPCDEFLSTPATVSISVVTSSFLTIILYTTVLLVGCAVWRRPPLTKYKQYYVNM